MALDESILKQIKSDVTGNRKKYYFTSADGKRYSLDFSGGDEYITDDFGYKGRKETVAKAVSYLFKTGSVPSKKMLAEILYETGETITGFDKDGNPYITDKTYNNVTNDIYTFLDKNKISLDTIKQSLINANVERRDADGNVIPKGVDIPTNTAIDPEEAAKEHYYNDLYSLDEGTSGKEMYDRLAEAYLNQAQAQSIMADVQYQNQAMQQAQIVKNITDQIRAERMARLRAGMNEAQIANQDMQMMMANVNALNQNAQMMNQQRLEAQFNMATARDQAYQAYLDQANARGQNAAAFYAADSGNAYWNALQYMMMVPGSTYEEALRATQAMYEDKNKK
jgi:hypothetical protein